MSSGGHVPIKLSVFSSYLSRFLQLAIRFSFTFVSIVTFIPFMPPSFLRYDEGRQSGLYLLPPPAAFSSSESI